MVGEQNTYREVVRGVSDGRMLITGLGPLADVSTEIVPSTLCLTPAQSQQKGPAVDKLRAQGQTVTDGPIYRLESWSVVPKLHLRLSRRSYFDSVVLKQNPEWGIRSQVLCVACVTLCANGYLVERRSQRVASLPGFLHPVPAGGVEPPFHPFHTFETEAEEELGLKACELFDVQCIGLVFGETSGVYQLVARASTSLSKAEIEARTCSGQWERSELLCAPSQPKALSHWLSEHTSQLTAGGRTAIVMEGGRRWGEGWLQEHLE
jgi:hypothetical protein